MSRRNRNTEPAETASAANRGCADGGEASLALDHKDFGRSSRAKALRDAKIVAARARGKSWPTIAREHNLSVRGCQMIVKAWKDDGLADDVIDPLGEVRALVDLLGQAIEDCAELEERTKNDGVRIAATRTKIEHAMTRFGLLRSLGLVPSPRQMQTRREMQEMIRVMGELMRRHDVSDELLAEFSRAFEPYMQAEQPALGA